MTLNGVLAVALRYFTEFGKPAFWHNSIDLWRNLWTSLLYFVVRVRCRRYLISLWISCSIHVEWFQWKITLMGQRRQKCNSSSWASNRHIRSNSLTTKCPRQYVATLANDNWTGAAPSLVIVLSGHSMHLERNNPMRESQYGHYKIAKIGQHLSNLLRTNV